jgi:hypothetical protein
MTGQPVSRPASGDRCVALSSEWLINHIREHGGVMTVVRDVVID